MTVTNFPRGAKGETGAKGEKGETGAKGEKGESGVAIPISYQLVTNNEALIIPEASTLIPNLKLTQPAGVGTYVIRGTLGISAETGGGLLSIELYIEGVKKKTWTSTNPTNSIFRPSFEFEVELTGGEVIELKMSRGSGVAYTVRNGESTLSMFRVA